MTTYVLGALFIAGVSATVGALDVPGAAPSPSTAAETLAVKTQSIAARPLWEGKLQSLASAARLQVADAALVGTFDIAGLAKSTSVYRIPAAGTRECLVVIGPSVGATCLDGGLLRDRRIALLVSYSARKTPDDLVYQQIAGVVDPIVERLVAKYTDGTGHDVQLLPTDAFLHVVGAADLARGAALAALVAYDRAGEIVAEQGLRPESRR